MTPTSIATSSHLSNQPQMAALNAQYKAFLQHKSESEALKRRMLIAKIKSPVLMKFVSKPVPTAVPAVSSEPRESIVGSCRDERSSQPSDRNVLSPVSNYHTPHAGEVS